MRAKNLVFAKNLADKAAVLALMRQADAAMSAIPYYFNYDLAEMAVEAAMVMANWR